jgi:hypothetical protein
MGAHASYPLIIYNLVSLKNQFQFISDEKFQAVIKELSDYLEKPMTLTTFRWKILII